MKLWAFAVTLVLKQQCSSFYWALQLLVITKLSVVVKCISSEEGGWWKRDGRFCFVLCPPTPSNNQVMVRLFSPRATFSALRMSDLEDTWYKKGVGGQGGPTAKPHSCQPLLGVWEPVFPFCRPGSFVFSLVAAAFRIPTGYVAVERRNNVVRNTDMCTTSNLVSFLGLYCNRPVGVHLVMAGVGCLFDRQFFQSFC